MIKKVLAEPTISFLGNKGRGKTVGSAILVNNMESEVLIIDTVGAFSKDRLIKDAIYIEVDVRKFDKKMFFPIFKKFKDKKRIVLNVQRLTSKELIEFSEIIFGLVLDVGDIGLVVDEVGEIVSQQKEKYSPEYERLVRIGRNYNIRPVIQITQRPQKVDKNVLALTDFYCVMGLSHNLDLNAVQDLIGYSKEEFQTLRGEIKKQGIGDCLLVKHDGTVTKTKFNMEKDILKERIQAPRQKEVLKNYGIEEKI
jgi:hypothetical protein